MQQPTSEPNNRILSGRLGVFWIYHGTILDWSRPWKDVLEIEEVRDLPLSHLEVWNKFREKQSDLFEEYEEVPRGRILMTSRPRRVITYSSRHVIRSSHWQKTITCAFNWRQDEVLFRHDQHYEPANKTNPNQYLPHLKYKDNYNA